MSTPARILFVSQTAAAAGPTTSLGLLIDRIAQKHEVGVLFCGDGPFRERLEEKNVPYWSLPSLTRERIPEVYGLLRRERFDLVYANETSGSSRNACWTAALTGTPFVSHVRSMGWDHGWRRLGHLKAARAVIAVSRACAHSVERYVRPGRLHVVHNGMPPPAPVSGRNGNERGRIKAELGLSPDDRLVLNVGRVSPRKGQLHALEAMGEVVAQVPDARLVLAGAYEQSPDYVRQLCALGSAPPLDGKVRLLGHRSDVARLLSAADAVFHTALADPHPRAVLEAMAAGVPVVAFATDGVAETVIHGRTGYLVSPRDARRAAAYLTRILTDRGRAREMGKAGRERVALEFSEARTSCRVEGIVEKALTSGALQ